MCVVGLGSVSNHLVEREALPIAVVRMKSSGWPLLHGRAEWASRRLPISGRRCLLPDLQGEQAVRTQ